VRSEENILNFLSHIIEKKKYFHLKLTLTPHSILRAILVSSRFAHACGIGPHAQHPPIIISCVSIVKREKRMQDAGRCVEGYPAAERPHA
jgi:hypothetical protein